MHQTVNDGWRLALAISVLPILLFLWVFSPAVKGAGLQMLVIRAVIEKLWGLPAA